MFHHDCAIGVRYVAMVSKVITEIHWPADVDTLSLVPSFTLYMFFCSFAMKKKRVDVVDILFGSKLFPMLLFFHEKMCMFNILSWRQKQKNDMLSSVCANFFPVKSMLI